MRTQHWKQHKWRKTTRKKTRTNRVHCFQCTFVTRITVAAWSRRTDF